MVVTGTFSGRHRELYFFHKQNTCGDQLLVNCFDITNIYINIFDKDVNYRSAHVTKLYITNLYKQDAVSVTRLQCICGISDFELSIIAFKSI